MKKLTAILLAVVCVVALAACAGGNTDGNTDGNAASSYADALEVLNTVWATYEEENKFPIGGGDFDNMTMDAPGKFDIAQTEQLDTTLALPASQAENIEDAASLVHMMNANTFTGATYRLKADADAAAFADEFKANLDGRHWMCGFPEKFIVVKSGSYVVTAFGNGEIIELFKTKALGALENAEVVMEDVIAA